MQSCRRTGSIAFAYSSLTDTACKVLDRRVLCANQYSEQLTFLHLTLLNYSDIYMRSTLTNPSSSLHSLHLNLETVGNTRANALDWLPSLSSLTELSIVVTRSALVYGRDGHFPLLPDLPPLRYLVLDCPALLQPADIQRLFSPSFSHTAGLTHLSVTISVEHREATSALLLRDPLLPLPRLPSRLGHADSHLLTLYPALTHCVTLGAPDDTVQLREQLGERWCEKTKEFEEGRLDRRWKREQGIVARTEENYY